MIFAADSLGIYIHVPFCLKKCPYCDFYSCENRLHERELYVQAVCRNIGYYGNDKNIIRDVDTIYFGGGTPSLLLPEDIDKILGCIYDYFNVSTPEVTIEVNPATVTQEKLAGYRKAGVNRISIGLQDLKNDSLESLGRLHTAEQGIEAVYDSLNAGFKNISCDLMIGTKGQTKDRLLSTLEELTEIPINHISAYMLKIENGTPYSKQNMQRFLPDDDATAELYLSMVSYLSEKGFKQYEISNFAKSGAESRHNYRYWNLLPYIGIGPSAHSFINERFFVPSDLKSFIREEHQSVIIEDKCPDVKEERIMLGLRLSEGIPFSWLNEYQQKKVERFVEYGLMQRVSDRICFTPKGFLVSNAILCELL